MFVSDENIAKHQLVLAEEQKRAEENKGTLVSDPSNGPGLYWKKADDILKDQENKTKLDNPDATLSAGNIPTESDSLKSASKVLSDSINMSDQGPEGIGANAESSNEGAINSQTEKLVASNENIASIMQSMVAQQASTTNQISELVNTMESGKYNSMS